MREKILDHLQRERIQSRINHFLIRCRRASGMTQSGMAKKLGYSISAYRMFERSAETDNRLINAIEIIKQFADLDNMTAGDFINYLEKGRTSQVEGSNLRRWESDLLTALKRVDQSIRRDWSEALIECKKDALSRCLKVMTGLVKLDYSRIEAIRVLTEPLVK